MATLEDLVTQVSSTTTATALQLQQPVVEETLVIKKDRYSKYRKRIQRITTAALAAKEPPAIKSHSRENSSQLLVTTPTPAAISVNINNKTADKPINKKPQISLFRLLFCCGSSASVSQEALESGNNVILQTAEAGDSPVLSVPPPSAALSSIPTGSHLPSNQQRPSTDSTATDSLHPPHHQQQRSDSIQTQKMRKDSENSVNGSGHSTNVSFSSFYI
jgi:hypothetical protein